MAIDETNPPDNVAIPLLGAIMRAVWIQLNNAYIIYPIYFTVSGNLVVGANKAEDFGFLIDAARPAEIIKVTGRVKTAPLTQSILIDVNRNNVSIFATAGDRLTIPAAAVLPTADSTVSGITLADRDRLTIDVDQVGVGTVGADLTVAVIVKQRVTIP